MLTEFDMAEEIRVAIEGGGYADAKRQITRRLLESLLYEQIVRPTQTVEAGGALVFSLPAVDAQGGPVTYTCRGHRRDGFARLRLEPATLRRHAAGEPSDSFSLTTFLLEIRPEQPFAPARLAQFVGEIEQTLLKDAQARAFLASAPPLRDATYDVIESGLSDGHPYHPSYKSRVGFDLAANQRFGPEFGPRVRPYWVALHRARARLEAARGLNPYTFLARDAGDDTMRAWQAALAARSLDLDRYVFLPVHPWQWQQVILPYFAEEIRDHEVVPLGVAPHEYRPQQSIRTLANASRLTAATLKHSLSIVNTSTSRILAPHTVCNAPIVSDWLHTIVAADPALHTRWRPVLLREVLGVAHDHAAPELLFERSYGALSCIWRESIHVYLEPHEGALPWSALTHLDRDGHPLVAPWVEHAGPLAWLQQLVEISVPPLLHLLVAHGVGLEAHAQNMILLHRQGWPTRVGLKDFHDGVRFAPAYLAAPPPPLQPTPARHVRVNRNSFLVAEHPEQVRHFLLDALLFINFSEIALFWAEYFAISESEVWSVVRCVVASYRDEFVSQRERLDRFAVTASVIAVEKLTNRRLYDESDVQVHTVPNPLAAC